MNKQVYNKFQKALAKLYKDHGVGDTIQHKLAFWNKKEPGTFISHNPTNDQRVAVHEAGWLLNKYPSDFSLH